MRFALRLVMLWTAGLLLMAHSVVPHEHHNTHASGTHWSIFNAAPDTQQPSPLEADLGSDHLEHFRLDEENGTPWCTGPDSPILFQVLPSISWIVLESNDGTLGVFPPALDLMVQHRAAWGGIRPPPVRL